MKATFTILHIKNMVCERCKQTAGSICTDLGYEVVAVELGQVVVRLQTMPAHHPHRLVKQLNRHGFELLDSSKALLVERVKLLLIVLLFQNGSVQWPVQLAWYLEAGLKIEFEELNQQFLSQYGVTVREYFEALRFERAKELIAYGECSIRNIAEQLGFGTTDGLSIEFKRRLNLDLAEYLEGEKTYRVSLDRII